MFYFSESSTPIDGGREIFVVLFSKSLLNMVQVN